MRKLRLYLDTTIPNYVFAEHLNVKRDTTVKFLRDGRKGKYELFISDIVVRELKAASDPKRSNLLREIEGLTEFVATVETEILAREYVKHRVISSNYIDDARHVAIATVNNLDAVVSWNYGHLVNINKIKGINVVNDIMGYKHIEVVSPEEVVEDDREKC